MEKKARHKHRLVYICMSGERCAERTQPARGMSSVSSCIRHARPPLKTRGSFRATKGGLEGGVRRRPRLAACVCGSPRLSTAACSRPPHRWQQTQAHLRRQPDIHP